MPSPFPGMDPYIESWIWGDFHARLITTICDRLNPTLPKRYLASTELFVWRVDNSEEERLLLGGPDVHVVERKKSRPARNAVGTQTAPITTRSPGTGIGTPASLTRIRPAMARIGARSRGIDRPIRRPGGSVA